MAITTVDRIKVTVGDPQRLCGGDWYSYDNFGGTNNTTKLRATAGGPKQVVKGESELKDITVKAYYDASVHDALLQALQDGNALEGTTLSLITLDKDGATLATRTVAGCAVVDWDGPVGDANGDSPAEIALQFSVASK